MDKHDVLAGDAPAPTGPYSHAIVANGFVFAAGQGGFHPQTGELSDGVEMQTEQALRNVEAILVAAGSSLDRAVKISVFLADLGDFAAMNEVYRRLVPEPRPARTTVEAGLAPGMPIEVDAVALT